MQKLSTFLFMTLFFSLFGCATLESNYQYAKGMDALALGDHKAAIVHLEEAVRLDSERLRNRNGLADACLAAGRIQDGWPHMRKAVDLDRGNADARVNFGKYFEALVKEVDLSFTDSLEDFRRKLGTPDEEYDRDGNHWLRYGIAAFEFHDGKFLTLKDLTLP